ncbi:DUF4013 domain-containing protein [Halomarina pelagica]|uniref:DUF4013 domain-containing protein n=1 Tax=Halomarina pelagica TaxID=2961599 RepID=UPI0020C4A11C|nr:DUF4013 domain-containing protein [Halomarina sp. BND7]
MFRDALLYPLSGPSAAGSYLLGGVLRLVSTISDVAVLLVSVALATATVDAPAGSPPLSPTVLVVALAFFLGLSLVARVAFRGYAVAVAREVAGAPSPVAPSIRAFVRLGDAARSVGVLLAYLLPALSLGGLAALTVTIDAGGDLDVVVETVGALALLLGLLAGLLAAYLVPVAMVRFAHEGGIRAAFDLSAVRAAAFTEDYVVGWAMAAGVVVVLVPLALLLYALFLVGVVVHFHLNVTVRYLLARSASAALGYEPGTATAPSGSARQRRNAGGSSDEESADEVPADEVSLDDTASARAAAEADWRGTRPEPSELDPAVSEDDPAAEEFRRRR